MASTAIGLQAGRVLFLVFGIDSPSFSMPPFYLSQGQFFVQVLGSITEPPNVPGRISMAFEIETFRDAAQAAEKNNNSTTRIRQE